jgi:cellulose synthase/poly-beta-1,6-N-acetylglucosamine synthase-like glycosyltransferase
MTDWIPRLAAFMEEHRLWVMVLSWTIVSVGLIQTLTYLLQLPTAWLELRRHSQAGDTETSWKLLTAAGVAPPISLLVPAYNEEAVIVQSVRSMLALEYPEIEVIVVNDGSKDGTLRAMIEGFGLKRVARVHERRVPHAEVRGVYGSPTHPRLLLVDKANGGKADAINAGINFSRCPLFCVGDADSLLEGQALLSAARPFMEDPERMVAVGGTIRVVNGCEVKAGRVVRAGLPRRFLPLVQTMEYIRAYLMARLALSRWGALTIISGAFGIFRRDVALEVGGFSHGTVGEDLEIILKMHRSLSDRKADFAMRFVPEPVCWTEAPESLKILRSQRTRWERGALEGFFKHKDMLFNPRYGNIGMVAFPLSLVTDVLGPIAEVLGYLLIPVFWLLGVLSLHFFLAFTALVFIIGVFISACSLILEEMELKRVPRARDLLILIGVAVIENFGYRQINNWWRVVGWWQFLRKKRGWGEMTRKGFATAPKGP